MIVDAIDRERLARAERHMRSCTLCEHQCGVDRIAGERGPCKAGIEARVFRHRVELGEELELIPSHLFYLSGCDLRCAFCIAEANAFNPHVGTNLTADFLSTAIAWGRQRAVPETSSGSAANPRSIYRQFSRQWPPVAIYHP